MNSPRQSGATLIKCGCNLDLTMDDIKLQLLKLKEQIESMEVRYSQDLVLEMKPSYSQFASSVKFQNGGDPMQPHPHFICSTPDGQGLNSNFPMLKFPSFVKDKLPIFDGSQDVKEWIFVCDLFIEKYKISESNQVFLVASHLKGNALFWYNDRKKVLSLMSWSDFSLELKSRFILSELQVNDDNSCHSVGVNSVECIMPPYISLLKQTNQCGGDSIEQDKDRNKIASEEIDVVQDVDEGERKHVVSEQNSFTDIVQSEESEHNLNVKDLVETYYKDVYLECENISDSVTKSFDEDQDLGADILSFEQSLIPVSAIFAPSSILGYGSVAKHKVHTNSLFFDREQCKLHLLEQDNLKSEFDEKIRRQDFSMSGESSLLFSRKFWDPGGDLVKSGKCTDVNNTLFRPQREFDFKRLLASKGLQKDKVMDVNREEFTSYLMWFGDSTFGDGIQGFS